MARPLTLDDLPIVSGAPALTAAQMAEVDRAAEHELGLGAELLMENASRQVAHAARLWLGGRVAERGIVVLAGRGNNGGDALGAARHLLDWGASVACICASPVSELRGQARRQFDILAALGQRPTSAPPRGEALPDEAGLTAALARAELIVDGLLGTSARGAPRDEVAALIRIANRSRSTVLAVDLPSGIDPDSGTPLGVAIRAAVTVTLALPKPGLLDLRAANLVGELLLADIGVPPVLYERFGLDARGLFVDGDLVRIARA